jgi:sugar lactone lactonase YvrE
MTKVELAADARAALGECPRWHAGERALYWVDIPEQALCRTDPQTGETRTRRFDQPVGCFAFRQRGGLVLAMQEGFARLDDFDAAPELYGEQVEQGHAEIRFNDGRADARGRFWAGTVNMAKTEANGALYRLDPDGEVSEMRRGVTTSNGLAFSPDGTTAYWADTPRHVVWAFDFDLHRGLLSGQRVFHEFPHGQGRPDGASVDEAGYYWCALYDGGRVVRLSPAGEIVQEVAIPARFTTMIGFGGDDLKTAFVTTARKGLDDAELAQTPHAGGVFRFEVDTPGLAESFPPCGGRTTRHAGPGDSRGRPMPEDRGSQAAVRLDPDPPTGLRPPILRRGPPPSLRWGPARRVVLPPQGGKESPIKPL